MRKISRRAAAGLTAIAAAACNAAAQDGASPAQPIIVPSQSSVYNQNSVYLPTPPTVNGQDIIRGAGGTSCQTAVASAGPYVDMGLIGSEDVFERSTAALYGRVVVPLGRRAKRVDCTRLYELEIARMQVELEMLRMTAMMPMPTDGGALSSGLGDGDDEEAAKGFTLGEAPAAAAPQPLAPSPARTPVAHRPAAKAVAPVAVVYQAAASDRPDPAIIVHAALARPAQPEAPAAAPAEPAIAPAAPEQIHGTAPAAAEPVSAPPPESAEQEATPAPAIFVLTDAPEGARRHAEADVGAPAAPETVPIPPTAQPVPPAEAYFVQLGAFSTLERARLQMKTSLRQLGAQGTGAEVRPIERESRTLYRALLGPMSKTDAGAACARLAEGCFVSRG